MLIAQTDIWIWQFVIPLRHYEKQFTSCVPQLDMVKFLQMQRICTMVICRGRMAPGNVQNKDVTYVEELISGFDSWVLTCRARRTGQNNGIPRGGQLARYI